MGPILTAEHSNKRTAKTDPAKDELHFLKSVANRHERAGSILHLAIAWYLRESQRGNPPDIDRLVGWARRLFEADRQYSRQHPDGGGPEVQVKFPPILLREYHYRQTDADQLCDEAESRLLAALHDFATNQCYSDFRGAGSWPDALIEYPIRLGRGETSCRAEGKIDLARGSAESALVVDWKLGAGDGTGDDSLQLAVYALWAVKHFGCDPRSLRICKVHLTSSEVVNFRADHAVLTAARARIVQDATLMAAVQPYGEAGTAEAFTPCALPAVCNGCSFQRVCPAGRDFISA